MGWPQLCGCEWETNHGNNLTHAVEGDYLVIRVRIRPDDVNDAPLSSTGKSVVVGATSGFDKLGIEVGGLALSLKAGVYAAQPKGK